MAAVLVCLALGLPCRGGHAHAVPEHKRGGHAVTIEEPPLTTAERVAQRRGWVGSSWRCLAEIIDRESRGNPRARNRSSGAYGLGQALPPSKMAAYGRDYLTSAATQTRWMIGYVTSRYGSPCVALAFHSRHGWY